MENNIKASDENLTERQLKRKYRMTKEEFINKANEIHHNKYDYSKSDYVDYVHKIIVICPEHGEFKVSPCEHIAGRGCPICDKIYGRVIPRKLSTKKAIYHKAQEDFINRVKEVYGDKYDYSSVQYNGDGYNVRLICPEHGGFKVKAGSLYSDHGELCPKCKKAEKNRILNEKRQENFDNYGVYIDVDGVEREFAKNVIKELGITDVKVHKDYQNLCFPTATFYLREYDIAILVLPEKYFKVGNDEDVYEQRLNRLRDMLLYYKKYNINYILFNENHDKILDKNVVTTFEKAKELLISLMVF